MHITDQHIGCVHIQYLLGLLIGQQHLLMLCKLTKYVLGYITSLLYYTVSSEGLRGNEINTEENGQPYLDPYVSAVCGDIRPVVIMAAVGLPYNLYPLGPKPD